jgi:hypothetical protein
VAIDAPPDAWKQRLLRTCSVFSGGSSVEEPLFRMMVQRLSAAGLSLCMWQYISGLATGNCRRRSQATRSMFAMEGWGCRAEL